MNHDELRHFRNDAEQGLKSTNTLTAILARDGLALLTELDQARQREARLREAATRLLEELVVDEKRRDVTWFYDGASAVNKVNALRAALAAKEAP